MQPGKRQPCLRLDSSRLKHRHALLACSACRRSEKRRLADPSFSANNESTATLADPAGEPREARQLDVATQDPGSNRDGLFAGS